MSIYFYRYTVPAIPSTQHLSAYTGPRDIVSLQKIHNKRLPMGAHQRGLWEVFIF